MQTAVIRLLFTAVCIQNAECDQDRVPLMTESENCVQRVVSAWRLAAGGRAFRDGKDPTAPALRFTPAEWAVLTAGVRDGQFD